MVRMVLMANAGRFTAACLGGIGGGTVTAGTGAAAQSRGGRSRFRPIRPWALCHRRLALSDHAARRGAAAHDRRSRTCDRNLPFGEGTGDAARRRLLAV